VSPVHFLVTSIRDSCAWGVSRFRVLYDPVAALVGRCSPARRDAPVTRSLPGVRPAELDAECRSLHAQNAVRGIAITDLDGVSCPDSSACSRSAQLAMDKVKGLQIARGAATDDRRSLIAVWRASLSFFGARPRTKAVCHQTAADRFRPAREDRRRPVSDRRCLVLCLSRAPASPATQRRDNARTAERTSSLR